MQQESPKSLHAIFETLRSILHQSDIDMRIQYMIEVMFAIRKDADMIINKDFIEVIPDKKIGIICLTNQRGRQNQLESLSEGIFKNIIHN